MGQIVSSSHKSFQTQESKKKRLLATQQRKVKQKTTKRSEVVFLPYPYIHPDSKPPTNACEYIIVEMLTKYANQNTSLSVDYFTLGATVEFPGITMDAPAFIDLTQQMMDVFPDFHFEYQLLGETSPGVVVAIIQACGTHSRGPYSTFLQHQPLPARNAKCKNDPEYLTCVLKGSKIVYCSFLPVSKDTQNHGPDGFYKQIKEQENL